PPLRNEDSRSPYRPRRMSASVARQDPANRLLILRDEVDHRLMASVVDLAAHIGRDFLHWSEPDIALRHQLFEELGEHVPAGKAAGDERMHDWHPQGAVCIGGLEFAQIEVETVAGATDRHHVMEIH